MLELKRIKHHKSMSQETPCYEGVLYYDRRAVWSVENRGTGGPDFFHRVGSQADSDLALAAAEHWCATDARELAGREKYGLKPPTGESALEAFSQAMLYRDEDLKWLKRNTKKGDVVQAANGKSYKLSYRATGDGATHVTKELGEGWQLVTPELILSGGWAG